MKHAYNEIYIRLVMHNLAAMFDIAINAERIDADEFANAFASSYVAQGIEKGDPNILAGKAATEMLMIILDREVEFDSVPMNRTPEYWAGWILAIVQWELNRSFKEILSAISFSQLVRMYYPYHEADEQKTVELIINLFSTKRWEDMTPEEKKRELFLKQKKTLDLFLERNAISKAQYDKSLGDLREKMGMQGIE